MNTAAPIAPPMRRAIATLHGLCLVLATHGSLYPWRFAWPSAGWSEAWRDLWVVHGLWTGLGDVVGNVALFVPVGVLMLLHLQCTRWPPRLRLATMLVAGTSFAWLLQAAQIFVPSRDPELSDVVWNALGLVIGAAVARLVLRLASLPAGSPLRGHGLALGLAALWLASEWWPLTPTIDWQHMKDALKPLLRDPTWRPFSAIEGALCVLAVAHLLRGLRHRATWLILVLLLALGGKLFIDGQAISFSRVAGYAAGLAGAAAAARVPAGRAAAALTLAVFAWLTLDGLRPFEPATHAGSFEFIPFVAMLKGSMQANALALMTMVFWVGLAMVLGLELGARLGGLAAALSVWLLLLEAAQVWLPQRTAEITPALVPWLWLLLLRPFSATAPRVISRPPRRRTSTR